MSGGHFGFRNDYLKDDIFGCSYRSTVDGRVPNVFEDVEISNLIYDVFILIHAFDYYQSGDTDEEEYIKAKEGFKKKWLGLTQDERVEAVITELLDGAKKEAKVTFGLDVTTPDWRQEKNENRF